MITFTLCGMLWAVTTLPSLKCVVKKNPQACSVSLNCSSNETVLYCRKDPEIVIEGAALRASGMWMGNIQCVQLGDEALLK